MSYKRLIVKIQKLKAHTDRQISELKTKNNCVVDIKYINQLENFSNDLENILISEEYGMKKYFKY